LNSRFDSPSGFFSHFHYWVGKLTSGMLLPVGLLFFVVGVGMGMLNVAFVVGTAATEGIVTGVQGRTRFEYTVDGKMFTGQSKTISDPPAYSVGDRVPVRYKKNAPGTARLASFMELWFFPIFFPLIGIALVGAMCVSELRASKESGGESGSTTPAE